MIAYTIAERLYWIGGFIFIAVMVALTGCSEPEHINNFRVITGYHDYQQFVRKEGGN